jgi:hypothetical protein
MKNCPHCGGELAPAKKKLSKIEAYPHPDRPGFWVYIWPTGRTVITTMGGLAKAFEADDRRRAKMSLKYGTAERNRKLMA